MKLSKKAVALASMLLAMALTACSTTTKAVYAVPALNEADRARLSCSSYPELAEALAELPAHEFLAGVNGEPIVTPDGERYVKFSVSQQRELVYVRAFNIEGRNAHFECRDDLQWLGDVYEGLEG